MNRQRIRFWLICLFVLAVALPGQTVVPVINTLSPSSAPVNTPGLVMTVLGANFRAGAYVTWNGFPLATTVNSSIQATVTIPAPLLQSAGVVAVALVNPGSVTSNTLSFRVGSVVEITTADLPQGAVGTPYSATLAATGGTAPYTWTAAGALPPGLALSPAGVISGTPTTAGKFDFTVQAADAAGQTGTKALSITVEPPAFSITTPSQLPPATAGQAYSQALAVSGGTAPYRWAVSQGFPAGLRLDPATGVISGTPTLPGSFNFAVQVSDANQRVATRNFSLTVTAPPLNITTVSPLFSGTVGVPYAQTFSASGGVPPYQWSVLSGDTGGLTLDAGTGTLQGTPQSAGTFNFTVQVRDSAGTTASRPFSLQVNPPSLVITTGSTLPGGSVGVSYTQTFSVTGGTAPYVWSMVSGFVPGLTLASSGTLSGVPTEPGNFSFSLLARDALGVTATRAFTIAIAPAPLGISSATDLPDAMLNEPFLHELRAAGGAPPYTWSANGLPEGLSIDASTGVISGIPAAAGSFSFTVRVTDNARATFVELFRIRVNLPPGPSATISGLPEIAAPAEQYPFRITLGSPYPAPISGQAQLTFAPDSGAGDSTIQFASGGRTANFTVPADTVDAVTAVPLAIQTGTVAGTITVSVRLTAGGTDITPVPAPAVRIRVERAAPVIRSARMVRSGNGITVEITGFSTAREVTQISVTFAASAGQTLQNSTVTVPVENLFSQWFQDPASSQFGSQFFFSQPFTITGDVNAVTAQSVTLTNRVGTATMEIER